MVDRDSFLLRHERSRNKRLLQRVENLTKEMAAEQERFREVVKRLKMPHPHARFTTSDYNELMQILNGIDDMVRDMFGIRYKRYGMFDISQKNCEYWGQEAALAKAMLKLYTFFNWDDK